jgi:hypothetical protein
VQYQWLRYSWLRRLAPMTNPMAEMTEKAETLHVTVEHDKTYSLYFDHETKEYRFEEKM